MDFQLFQTPGVLYMREDINKYLDKYVTTSPDVIGIIQEYALIGSDVIKKIVTFIYSTFDIWYNIEGINFIFSSSNIIQCRINLSTYDWDHFRNTFTFVLDRDNIYKYNSSCFSSSLYKIESKMYNGGCSSCNGVIGCDMRTCSRSYKGDDYYY